MLKLSYVLILFAVLSAGASAQNSPTVWNLNGSQMELLANGNQREFRYKTVRDGLAEVGIQPGTLSFKGWRNGNEYSGTAYVYWQSCGALPYSASGTVSSDERSVTIRGQAPSLLTENCEVVGYRDAVSIFEFLPDRAGTAQIATAERDYGTDGRLFSAGKDDYYLLTRAQHSSEEGGSYFGQVRVIHHFEGGGYQILMKDYSARCEPLEYAYLVTWVKAGDDTAPILVRIEHPDKTPKAGDKESYNLYWAACYEQFRKFK
jgi:hypothetical protein